LVQHKVEWSGRLNLLLSLAHAALSLARLSLGAAPGGRRWRLLSGGPGHEQLGLRLLLQFLLDALELGEDLLLLDDLLLLAAPLRPSVYRKRWNQVNGIPVTILL
jgi:hypothetical protein